VDLNDFHRQQLETQQLEDQLRRIERVERAALQRIKCPTDPAEIYRILARETRAPWSAARDAKCRARALHAMHALTYIRQVRQHSDNPRLAAYNAVLAGMYGGGAALRAMQADRARAGAIVGGKERGKQITAEARHEAREIAKQSAAYDSSDEAQDNSTRTGFVAERRGVSKRTVARHLKRLRPRK